MSDAMHAEPVTCLNGWWDFLPLYPEDVATPRDRVPGAAAPWAAGQLLVPSWWTKPEDAVRRPGETFFRDRQNLFKGAAETLAPDLEFLFDAFGYPLAWARTREGWLRRTLDLPARPAGRRWFLRFAGVMPRAVLFVNGWPVAAHHHPTLPFETDVTEFLRAGANEIALCLRDYERDERGRATTPTGNWIPWIHSGAWQDVTLVERGDVRVSDVTIRTSVRQQQLELVFEIANASCEPRQVTLAAAVHPWRKGATATTRLPVALALPELAVTLAPRETVTRTLIVPWADAKLWEPETPHLYLLRMAVREDGRVLDTAQERFGFREVWLDGPDLMLNGHPLHLFSDWGHKTTPYYLTEGWTRQWFRMLRDGNMNHSRLHTHPHPPFILDLADEEGILITGETGLHGSGQAIASDSPALWDTARDHLRRFVRRDKNHPCVILWSVENEMRWNGNQTSLTMEKLPELRRYFNELDPTRTAYHEGDSSLWNEAEQPLLSRHYYKACSGAGWWDRRQPLHAGEMALYHYAGPNNTSHLAGDRAWSEFKAIDVAAAQDAAWIIETGRTLGVICFGPWNLSCLENLRRERELVELKYADFTTPGMKPLRVPAHSSEFSFWRRGKGYTPNHSFAIQAAAFRPFAVIDRSRRGGLVAGAPFRRELFLVNDTSAEIRGGTLRVTLAPVGRQGAAAKPVASFVHVVETIPRGQTLAVPVALDVPAGLKPGRYVYACEFRSAAGAVLDQWRRPLAVGPDFAALAAARPPLKERVAVFGPGTLAATLATAGLEAVAVPDLKPDTLAGFRCLILEPNTVRSGSTMNQELAVFARRGGRALLLEQQVSPFFGLPVVEKPLQTQFVRAAGHPVLRGLKDADFAFWGDTPFPQLGGDACVTLRPFRKDDALHTRFLLDGDEGGFGDGGLRYTGLVEILEGDGLVLGCQLRLLERLATVPAAARLFYNLLRRLADYRPPAAGQGAAAPVLVDGTAAESANEAARLVAEARAGATVVVRQATPAVLAAFGRELGVDLRSDPRPLPVYQAVRVRDGEPLLAGVSNEDICGMDLFTYSSPQHFANHPVCEVPMAAVSGLDALLATPTVSLLKEFHVYEGRSEPLRAHTQSRFLFEEKPAAAIVLGRVRAGRGQIIFNQFAPPKELKPRYPRLDHRLLANLGMRFPGSPLDGLCVPCAGCSSPGFPERIHVLNTAVTPELEKNLVDATQYSVEHLGVAFPILAVPGWVKTAAPDGVVGAAGLDLGRDIFLYSPVVSPVSRKELSSNLGVPNPDALTFLDLFGEGEVTVTVNAATRRPLTLAGGRGTIPDLPLEQGGNHVLIRWRPAGSGSTLKLRWRNLNSQPETGFQFPA